MKSLTDVMSQKTDSVRYCCLSHNYSFPYKINSHMKLQNITEASTLTIRAWLFVVIELGCIVR